MYRLCNFSGSNAARFYCPATGAGAVASVGDAHRRKIDSPSTKRPQSRAHSRVRNRHTPLQIWDLHSGCGAPSRYPFIRHQRTQRSGNFNFCFFPQSRFLPDSDRIRICAISQSWLAECPNSGRPPSFTRIWRCALAVARSAIALTAFGLEHGML